MRTIEIRQPGERVAWDTDADQQIWYWKTDKFPPESGLYAHDRCIPNDALVQEAILDRIYNDDHHNYEGCRVCGVSFGKVKRVPRNTVSIINEGIHFI